MCESDTLPHLRLFVVFDCTRLLLPISAAPQRRKASVPRNHQDDPNHTDQDREPRPRHQRRYNERYARQNTKQWRYTVPERLRAIHHPIRFENL